jgi:hypothetical protein
MTAARVTRDVARLTPGNHSGRDVRAGETFHVFRADTYEVVSRAGIALSAASGHTYPFFEFPRDAVEVQR